jgi:hypothetical protein
MVKGLNDACTADEEAQVILEPGVPPSSSRPVRRL